MFTKAYIPYKGYSKWQESFANEHSIILGSKTAKNLFYLPEEGKVPGTGNKPIIYMKYLN